MSNLEKLSKAVDDLYMAKDANRNPWTDWMYPNHVMWVANKAEELAKRFGANPELAKAAALLHDLADVMTSREDEEHEAKSLGLARKIMVESGYTDEEVAVVVDDAVTFHSCHGGNQPKSLEGRCLAAADALAH